MPIDNGSGKLGERSPTLRIRDNKQGDVGNSYLKLLTRTERHCNKPLEVAGRPFWQAVEAYHELR